MNKSSSTAGALDDLHRSVAERLRGSEQRYTTGRRKLVELLGRSERPLTIPELLVNESKLAQSSLYRSLSVLEELDIVHRVVTSDDRARYELAEDLIGHHHHLICSSCGRVEDFKVSAQMERSLQAALGKATAGTGFRSSSHRLDLIGTCAGCT